jgi:hypothetical protein
MRTDGHMLLRTAFKRKLHRLEESVDIDDGDDD